VLKGEISKNNALLNSSVQSYFTSSEKLLDKKIEAYDALWKCAIKVKNQLPIEISSFYFAELESQFSYDEIKDNDTFAEILKLIDKHEEIINNIMDVYDTIYLYSPYINENTQKQYRILHIFVWKVTNSFIVKLKSRSIYNWRNDDWLFDKLKASLTEDEIKYIKEKEFGAFNDVFKFLELKIINAIKSDLNISYSAEDSIQQVKMMTEMYEAAFSKSK